MANRKGVFIGAYVPNHLKESLRRRAAAEHRTLSQEITRILEEAVHGGVCRPEASTGETKKLRRDARNGSRTATPCYRCRLRAPGHKSGDEES